MKIIDKFIEFILNPLDNLVWKTSNDNLKLLDDPSFREQYLQEIRKPNHERHAIQTIDGKWYDVISVKPKNY